MSRQSQSITIDVINVKRYYIRHMIMSFKDKDTAKIWNQIYSKQFPKQIQVQTLRKLVMIHRSRDIHDLKVPPGNGLEALTGDRRGQFSIRINEQWRICFIWRGNNAFEVEIVDYH